jgi:hypothetical protein
MSNNFKPWWEQVASFRTGKDQEEFLDGVYKGLTTSRPAQSQSYLMGLVAGYRNRKFAQPESFTGKQKQ